MENRGRGLFMVTDEQEGTVSDEHIFSLENVSKKGLILLEAKKKL